MIAIVVIKYVDWGETVDKLDRPYIKYLKATTTKDVIKIFLYAQADYNKLRNFFRISNSEY